MRPLKNNILRDTWIKLTKKFRQKLIIFFSFDDEDYDKVNVMDKGLGFHHKKNELKQARGQQTSLNRKRTGIPLPQVNQIKEVPMPSTLSHVGGTTSSESSIDIKSIARLKMVKMSLLRT